MARYSVKTTVHTMRKGELLFFLLIPLIAVGGISAALIFGESGADRRSRLTENMEKGRKLFEEIQPPAEIPTTPYGVRVERERSRKKLMAEVEQTYEAQGRFANVLQSYRDRLLQGGWLVAEEPKSEESILYCKPPWLLNIERDASYEMESKPHHRFRLRLQWIDGYKKEGCPIVVPFM